LTSNNAPAYFAQVTVMKKSFITLTTSVKAIKHFIFLHWRFDKIS